MRLYYAPGACSLAVHIALIESGLPFKLIRVDLREKCTETGQDYARINPKGYVPALELADGTVFTEAAVCALYVADLAPQTDLAPLDGTTERYRLMEWMNFISAELHKAFGPLFDPSSSTELRQHQVKHLEKRLGHVEAHLCEHERLLGDKLTVADAYLFTVLSWLRIVRIDPAAWPALQAYLTGVSEAPSVRAALRAEGLSQ